MPNAEIVATDLNQPMLDVAAQRADSERSALSQADAQALPFADGSFDLVVCQFGAMFFPDRVRGHSEARRVLATAGATCSRSGTDRTQSGDRTSPADVIDAFPDDPPLFMRDGPFSYHDLRDQARPAAAGFADIEIETVELRSRSPPATSCDRDVATARRWASRSRTGEPGRLERAFETMKRRFARSKARGQ